MCWSGRTVHIVSLSHLGDTILLVPEPGDPVIRTKRATESQSTGPQAGAGLAEWSTGGRSGVKYLMAPG